MLRLCNIKTITTYLLLCVIAIFLWLFISLIHKDKISAQAEDIVTSTEEVCKKDPSCLNLALAGYHEARGESDLGVYTVMVVILNRMNHDEKWPNSVKGVVNDKCQFSFTCNKSLPKEMKDIEQKERMYRIANDLIQKGVPEHFSNFTHFHSSKVYPNWSKKFKLEATIGSHKFYSCQKDC